MAEACLAVEAPAQQAVQRYGVQRQELVANRGLHRQLGRLLVDRLLQARGGLAGRRGQPDQGRRCARCSGLLVQQRQDPRHGGGLAGAGTAGDHRDPRGHGRRRGERLPAGDLVAEEPSDAVAEQRIVDCRRRTTGERDQVVGDLTLLAEVAVEVQARPVEVQRPRPVAHG